MCEGCENFFRRKKGVIRAAAAARASRFVNVDDLMSDIYFRTLRWKQNNPDYEKVSKGFFYSVAKNLAIDADRKRSHLEQFDDDKHSLIYEGQISLEGENAGRVKEIIETLMEKVENPNDRDSLFSFLAGESISSIAARQGITCNAASVRRRRAIEKVANLVQSGGL